MMPCQAGKRHAWSFKRRGNERLPDGATECVVK